MKRFSYNTKRFIDTSTSLMLDDKDRVKVKSYKDELDVLISSDEFIEKFRGYINDIARFKTVDGRKYMRSTDYAAIGILDTNDLYQEAYLAFLEAYAKFKELDEKGKFDYHESERMAAIWAYLKSSTILNFERQVRDKKDGIRVTEWALFNSTSVNTNFLTKLFSRLEVAFSNNVEEVAATKYDTDLTGYFLEVHMDEFLDKKPNGKRNLMGIERKIVKDFYGIDTVRKSSKEIAAELNKGYGTIDVVRKRALDKLRTEASKREIAYFLHEYRIPTGADIDKFKN